jgi:hypothetical protein
MTTPSVSLDAAPTAGARALTQWTHEDRKNEAPEGRRLEAIGRNRGTRRPEIERLNRRLAGRVADDRDA